MKNIAIAAVACCAMSCFANASPVIVSFGDVETGPGGYLPAPAINSNGFHFTSNGVVAVSHGNSGCPTVYCATNETNVIRALGALNTPPSQIITMTKLDAGTFTLMSFDVAEYVVDFGVSLSPADSSALMIYVTGFLDGVVTHSYIGALDMINDGPGGDDDFETMEVLGWGPVDKVSFFGFDDPLFNNAFSLDSILVNVGAAPPSGDVLGRGVPTPGAAALFGLGLLALTGTQRRARVW